MEVVTVEVVVQGRVEHPLSTSFLRVHASLLVSCCPQWLAVCDGGGRGPRNILRCSSEGKGIDTQALVLHSIHCMISSWIYVRYKPNNKLKSLV